MQKKYQIFISSTLTDLTKERRAVIEAVLKMHHFPAAMEYFNASNVQQWDVIKEEIDASDFYILIVGKKYGSVIKSGEDKGISYTQREFNYAMEQGVPILAFIKDGNFGTDDFEIDPDKLFKLQAFTECVKDGRVVEWFDNEVDLMAKVMAALDYAIKRENRPGWVRGNQVQIEDKVDELLKILKYEYGPIEEDDDDWYLPVEEYDFQDGRKPADGPHRKISDNGEVLAEGYWKDGELVSGIEYDFLIHVTQGKLAFKPDSPDDPYDASEDFEAEKLEQYGWKFPMGVRFGLSDATIEGETLEKFYVADMKVDGEYEQMTNIRTLEEFLGDKDPERLEQLKELSLIEY